MWASRTERLPADSGLKFTMSLDSRPATYADVLAAWRGDAAFRATFNALLANTEFSAFRWETPRVTVDTLSQPFEFVVLSSPALDRTPDPKPFLSYFRRAQAGVAVFPNLSGDATLIVPSPIGDHSAYGHIAAFVRNAPEDQRDAFWRSIGEATSARIGRKPVWLSTAGAGVAWLHARLDDRPKYYGFGPYRDALLK